MIRYLTFGGMSGDRDGIHLEEQRGSRIPHVPSTKSVLHGYRADAARGTKGMFCPSYRT